MFKVTKEENVAEIVFSRPEQANALTFDFFTEFPNALRKLEDDGDTNGIILWGEGKNFCAGLDLSVFQMPVVATSSVSERERFRQLAFQFQDAINAIERCRIPIIAAIHGACVGAGLDLVAACDFRFCVDSTSFCIQEINLGIMADLGSLQRLPKVMPEGVVRQLAYTGDAFQGRFAHQHALVNEVFASQEEMLNRARKVAIRIAQHSRPAIAASKEALNYARDHSVADALVQAANLQASIFERPTLPTKA